MKVYKVLAFFLCAIMLTSSAGAVDITSGLFGIDDYESGPLADEFKDRAGANYVRKFDQELENYFTSYGTDNTYENSYMYKDSRATGSRFRSKANGAQQTMFVFAGHGKAGIDYGPILYDEMVPKTDLLFEHLYVTMYCCNWLRNNGSTASQKAIYETFDGTRLEMGFASQMYLDSREARAYASNLTDYTVINAFINAAEIYQPGGLDKPVIARVVGYKNAKNDVLVANNSSAPTYAQRPSSFDTLCTVTFS